MPQRPIYLDGHATTRLDKRVLQAMMPYFCEYYGNPSSSTHQYGWEAAAAVKLARESLAAAIQIEPEEIIFTSGATEANNLAIKGVAEAYFNQGNHLITVKTEHRAVLDPFRYLETVGFDVTYLPVQSDGLLDLSLLEDAITPNTILVSMMTANNEIGVLHPLSEIGKICRNHNILFHTDAAQALGKTPLNMDFVDLMSITAHKLYGPKGVGALYLRRRHPKVNLMPQLHGGGQERGLRAGTLYPPQIVGFAKAVELAMGEQTAESKRLLNLRSQLWETLSQLDGIYLNGSRDQRLPGNLNISIDGVESTALMRELRSIVAFSSGSACSSANNTPSHVLTAIGRSPALAFASLRFGIGRFNHCQEIELVRKTDYQSHQISASLELSKPLT